MHLLLCLALLSPPAEPHPWPSGAVAPPAKAAAPPPKLRYIKPFVFQGIDLAVMNITEVTLDGVPKPYDAPDWQEDRIELAIISIDLQSRFVLKLAYVTRRDF